MHIFSGKESGWRRGAVPLLMAFISLVLCLGSAGSLMAQGDVAAVVSVADGYGDPGSTHNRVSIMMENEVQVAGLNFIINFDPDILAAVEVVATERTSEMSIFDANLTLESGKAILVIADIEGNPIQVGSGAIATFYFDVSSEAALGAYPLGLTEVTLADTLALEIPTDVIDGAFHVTGPSGNAWVVSIMAASSEPETDAVTLDFGVNLNGTDNFDQGLDHIVPPPPPEAVFWAYFAADGIFPMLAKDIRSSQDFDLSWTLQTGGSGGTLTWDPQSLPEDAILEINGEDMGAMGSLAFNAGDSFVITYAYQDQTSPAAVTGLQGLAGDQMATLTWIASVSPDVKGYFIYIDEGASVVQIDAGDVTYYEVMGLTNLQQYTFTVTAYDEMGNESSGESVNVTPNAGSFGIPLIFGSSEHGDSSTIFFGTDPAGTDGFDAHLDYACPPFPPVRPELAVYFPLDHPYFDMLCTDIRNSLDSTVVWTIVTEGSSGEVCWDSQDLPSGTFVLIVPDQNESDGTKDIDMRVQSCATFAQDDTLHIWFYQYDVSVDPGPEDKPIPTDFALMQNYPNPFNPETTIEYHLSRSSVVTLEVFNVLGQHIRTLANGPQAAGAYTVVWNGMDQAGLPMASGVYFCRFQADDFSSTRSMMLLK